MKLRMIPCCTFLSCVLLAAGAPAADPPHSIPHLQKRGAVTQLIVDDKPFLALAGELHNSSASSRQYMKPIWPRLARMNLNTVLAAVSWELTEPEEGKFDFTVVDGLIEDARHFNMRLVFLWFGSWKNGESSYPPYWVKTDRKRFPLAQNAEGKTLNILSTFGQSSRDADARAFAALMRHIRQVDEQQQTVIAIQVENECGVRGDSRDRSPAANEAFGGPVPPQLTGYLQQHKETLMPELRKLWEAAGAKTAGTWQEVFGRGLETDEIFMAWDYSQYVGSVAAAGKAEYPLPMYVNAWLVGRPDDKPGTYPSGGPLALVHDLWRLGAPQIDFLSPDLYRPDFENICALYTRGGNPLFIPETRGGVDGASNALIAFCKHNAMGFSPFGIEGRGGLATTEPGDDPLGQTYAVLSYLTPEILENQGKGTIVLLPSASGASGTPTQVQEKLGGYTLDISYTSGGLLGERPPRARDRVRSPIRSQLVAGQPAGIQPAGTPPVGAPPVGLAVRPAPAAPPAAAPSPPGPGPVVPPAATPSPPGPGPAAQPPAQAPSLPQNVFPGAIVIATGPDEFVFVGAFLNVKFIPAAPGRAVSLASFDESIYFSGRWVPGRRLNGDQTNNNKRWPSMAAFGIYRVKLYSVTWV